MSGVITGRSAFDADGNLMVYAPPNVVPVGTGTVAPTISVTYGDWVVLQAGDDPPGPGVYEIAENAGGTLRFRDTISYRTVTITGARS